MNYHPPHDFAGFFPMIRVGSDFALPTYYVVVSLSLCACVYWLVRRAEQRALRRNTALDLALACMIGGFFGARLFHVFFEEPAYYFEDLTRTLEIWRGGFVWYGGAIGGALTSIALARWRRLPIAKWLDVFAPILALGYALGRIACLFTGCCYGAICVLPSGYSFRYPTQAFAVLWEFAALAVLLLLEKKRNEGKSTAVYRSAGSLFACWLVIHSVGRLIMEYFRADPRGPSPLGMSLASWISVVLLIGASLWIWKKRRA